MIKHRSEQKRTSKPQKEANLRRRVAILLISQLKSRRQAKDNGILTKGLATERGDNLRLISKTSLVLTL